MAFLYIRIGPFYRVGSGYRLSFIVRFNHFRISAYRRRVAFNSRRKKKNNILIRTYNDIKEAFITMPLTMRQLIPVKFFTWYAMFCYWQYITSTLSISIYHTTDKTSIGFSMAQLLTGNLNGTYNIICF